jgi:hypothetical protein
LFLIYENGLDYHLVFSPDSSENPLWADVQPTKIVTDSGISSLKTSPPNPISKREGEFDAGFY